MNFKLLTQSIALTHEAIQHNAITSINRHITLRNLLIGYFISEYQQNGEDRARYGEKLMEKLVARLNRSQVKDITAADLWRFRQFYQIYAEILVTLSRESALQQHIPILVTVSRELEKRLEVQKNMRLYGKKSELTQHYKQLFSKASFSHFTELIKIDDEYKRAYYEMLVCKTQPSVRELRSAIHSLSYERTGLSRNKKKSFQSIACKIKPSKATDAIKDFYFFNFLELKNVSEVDETEMESALLNHLEKFILELGNGFCFEARQKRILIGDEYFFVDMVFYHRLLKCHVLIELKVDSFNHAHADQLRTYVRYYNKEIRVKGDGTAIGILLVTDKNKALVEYATENINEKMFVSKYAVSLPSRRQLENFIRRELRKM